MLAMQFGSAFQKYQDENPENSKMFDGIKGEIPAYCQANNKSNISFPYLLHVKGK